MTRPSVVLGQSGPPWHPGHGSGSPLIADLASILVASGIATPEQGARFIHEARALAHREHERAWRAAKAAAERDALERAAQPWWRRWRPTTR